MEQFLDQIIQTGPIGIICASVVYLIIYLQRKSTGEKRDTQNAELEKRIAIMENEVNRIKDLDLDARLSSIETSLSYIKILLERKNEN